MVIVVHCQIDLLIGRQSLDDGLLGLGTRRSEASPMSDGMERLSINEHQSGKESTEGPAPYN